MAEGMHAGASAHIFQLAAKLRDNMTKPEMTLWDYLRRKPFSFKFRRQHPFDKYILDFYCHQIKLSIEVDGKSHDSKEQKIYDENRTGLLRDKGIKEIRFKNEKVVEDLDSVIKEIELVLRAASFQGTQGCAEAID